jgi:hypothetical protein
MRTRIIPQKRFLTNILQRNVFHVKHYLLADAKTAEYLSEQVVCSKLAGNRVERELSFSQLFGKKLWPIKLLFSFGQM